MIKIITVIGAGTMGRSIASLFARYGIKTRLYDVNSEVLSVVKRELRQFESLEFYEDLSSAVKKSDLIIESVSENLCIKKKLLSSIAPYLEDTTVIASNTSSFSLKELSANVHFSNPICLMHFFNPADVIPLVELLKPENIDLDVFSEIIDLLNACQKVPVIVKRDIPGFVANRLQAAVLREACHLVSVGAVEESDIDVIMREGIGLRWACAGPFEVADYGGLDIWCNVMGSLLPDLDVTTEAPSILIKPVNQGRLGYKSGKGFYDYEALDDGNKELRNKVLKITVARS